MFDRFIRSITQSIKLGMVVKSSYATVGPYHTATGPSCYAVFEDFSGMMYELKDPKDAAKIWHNINMDQIKRYKNYF